jgi:RecA/RadA recombinase
MTKRIRRNSEGADEKAPSTPPGDKSEIDFLHSGSINFNLALSQYGKNGGWARGRIGNIVGDGSSGKTLAALEVCAYCHYKMLGNVSKNFPKVKEVKIAYNNVEGVMDFPIEDMYGEEFNKGVEWVRTGTVQDFGKDFFSRVNNLKEGQFLLYVVDSWDALDSEDELEAFQKHLKSDKQEEGSFNLGKQRYASKRFFKTLCSAIEGKDGKTGKDVTLLIISHLKKKIGVTFGEKSYRAGGDALNYYTHQVAWLAEAGKINKTKEGITVPIGIRTKAKIKRNKVAKPFREAFMHIMFDYGIDDVTGMIQYLYGEKTKEILGLFGMNFKTYDKAIDYVYENDMHDDLAALVEEKWNRIENSVLFNRKKKYL